MSSGYAVSLSNVKNKGEKSVNNAAFFKVFGIDAEKNTQIPVTPLFSPFFLDPNDAVAENSRKRSELIWQPVGK